MTDDLFTPQEDHPVVDPNKNYLNELVGEGKKFKTVEDLARGKFEADQYVEILKKRSDDFLDDYIQLRDERIAKARLEEYQSQPQSSNNPPPVKEEKPAINPDELDTFVSRKIRENETLRKQQENFKLVQDKLKERFGDRFSTILQQESEKLKMTTETVNNLARNQPEVLLRLVGADQQPSQDIFQSPPRSSQRTDNFAPRGPEKRTWSYYQNMKKANPELYKDRKTAIQMQQDAIELGETFRDGNYYVKGLHE